MNKRYLLFLLMVLFLGSFCTLFSQIKVGDKAFDGMLQDLLSHSVREVTPVAIHEATDVMLLDAREKLEFQVSHIKNALWVGYDDFKLKRVKSIPKNQKIVVYCSVGYRSEKVVEKLEKAGFKDVSNLYGGIFEWVHRGNKIFDKHGETKKVHTFDEAWSQWLLKGVKVY